MSTVMGGQAENKPAAFAALEGTRILYVNGVVADEARRTGETLYTLIKEAAGQPYSRIEKDCDRDYTLSAREAPDYGIVDEILRSHKNGRQP